MISIMNNFEIFILNLNLVKAVEKNISTSMSLKKNQTVIFLIF